MVKVLISGAGIAGLSLALRLHQRGLAPMVIERAPELRDGGYMLGLSDPGYQAAERMGVAETLAAARHLPARLVYMDGRGRETFSIGGRTLERLVGERQINLMRGDIERTLHDRVGGRVEIRFGASVETLERTQNGIAARLDDGTVLEADLIVGADGLHSRIRALRFGAEEQFVHSLGARVAAFVLDRSRHSMAEPGTSYSMTEVGRAVALADAGEDRMVAFFIWRSEAGQRAATAEDEVRRAFAGAGWRVPAMLDLLAQAEGVYRDEVAQAVVPRWLSERAVLIGDAACAVSLVAGKGATLAMAGACVLADALADNPADVDAACGRYEAWLRPLAEAAQRTARRNLFLFAPANRVQLAARRAVLRLAMQPLLAPLARRLLNRAGERLPD
jgi:2-polyprenyl-6-methoxyphenol hydroxylase-like FAD-dependent oxidoreductase